jgi:8-oxo-dGTP pyrophosphatase MutT (NUDIX family)
VPTPPVHLTASAVVVTPDGSRVLLLRHRRFGRWGPLGGHVEGAETLLDAVRREVVEESGLTGVRVLQPPLGTTQDLVTCGRDAKVRHRDHLFAVVADPEHPLAPEPGSALAWFAVGALPDPAVPGLGEWVVAAGEAARGARS